MAVRRFIGSHFTERRFRRSDQVIALDNLTGCTAQTWRTLTTWSGSSTGVLEPLSGPAAGEAAKARPPGRLGRGRSASPSSTAVLR